MHSLHHIEEYLDTLSTAAFMKAVDDICQHTLPTLSDNDFWQLVIRLTHYNNKAFLGSLLKLVVQRIKQGDDTLTASHHFLLQWAQGMTPIDSHKTLLALMPIATQPQQVSLLLEIFGQHHATLGHGHDIDYLIQADSAAAYFVLLAHMRINEHNKPLLTTLCRRLMRRGTPTAFNAASLFKAYFDLPDVRGTFSLRIQPYELGRLETDFTLFQQKVNA